MSKYDLPLQPVSITNTVLQQIVNIFPKKKVGK